MYVLFNTAFIEGKNRIFINWEPEEKEKQRQSETNRGKKREKQRKTKSCKKKKKQSPRIRIFLVYLKCFLMKQYAHRYLGSSRYTRVRACFQQQQKEQRMQKKKFGRVQSQNGGFIKLQRNVFEGRLTNIITFWNSRLNLLGLQIHTFLQRKRKDEWVRVAGGRQRDGRNRLNCN